MGKRQFDIIDIINLGLEQRDLLYPNKKRELIMELDNPDLIKNNFYASMQFIRVKIKWTITKKNKKQ